MDFSKWPKWARICAFVYCVLLFIYFAAFINMKSDWGFFSWADYNSNFDDLLWDPFSLLGFSISTLDDVTANTVMLTALLFVPVFLVFHFYSVVFRWLGLSEQTNEQNSKILQGPKDWILLICAIVTVHSYSAGLKKAQACHAVYDIYNVYKTARMPNPVYDRYLRTLVNEEWKRTLDTPRCDPDKEYTILRTGYNKRQMEAFDEFYIDLQDPGY